MKIVVHDIIMVMEYHVFLVNWSYILKYHRFQVELSNF